MEKNPRSKGTFYENIAASYLKTQGYTIIQTNYYYQNNCSKENITQNIIKRVEIDIIALKENSLHFFEVRKRKLINWNYPAISQSKINNINICALNFLENYPQYTNLQYNINLITIDGEGKIDILYNITI
jgi:Holliday junction resolvase-like predicted endonuclease